MRHKYISIVIVLLSSLSFCEIELNVSVGWLDVVGELEALGEACFSSSSLSLCGSARLGNAVEVEVKVETLEAQTHKTSHRNRISSTSMSCMFAVDADADAAVRVMLCLQVSVLLFSSFSLSASIFSFPNSQIAKAKREWRKKSRDEKERRTSYNFVYIVCDVREADKFLRPTFFVCD